MLVLLPPARPDTLGNDKVAGSPLSPEETKLMSAAADGEVETVRELLDAGVNVNCANEVGETPLHVAGIWGKIETVDMLIDAGADVNAQATGPKSLMMAPLHWMVYPGYTAPVESLIRAGAAVNMVIRNEAGDHITALDIVQKMGDSANHAGVLKLLEGAGAKTAAQIEGSSTQ